MRFLFAGATDVGIKKSTNQDSYCMREAETDEGNIIMSVICDGMGGLEKGELASKTIINAFESWFEEELPLILDKPNIIDEIKYQWERLVKVMNANIGEYGSNNHISLGSTATAFIILPTHDYAIVHVGDTRIYRITPNNIETLTADQTFVAREISLGRMTPEQAAVDPRRNVLLQCVGASKSVYPDFIVGSANHGECYMMCSDGFRHRITEKEIHAVLNPNFCGSENEMENRLTNLIEINKSRRETDNITAIMIKIQ